MLADQIEIALARVAAAHRLEHARRTRLHRQMQVPADLRQPHHGVQEPRRDVPRVRAGEPDPLDAVDVVNRFEQRREVAVRDRRAPRNG